MIDKVKEIWGTLSPSLRILILTAIVCIIGIAIRWKYIIEALTKAFSYYGTH